MEACSSDYPVLGMQSGEETATTLRLLALCISISVLFPWIDPKRRDHMRIFFLHWASGVMYVLSQFIMSVMVLNCWSSKDRAGPVIYALKFWELTVLNLWSISSLAITLLIASIVQSFANFRRVPNIIGSRRTAYACVGAALVLTCLSAPFWNGILVTGGYYWVTNTDHANHSRWISLSFGATQTVSGILMFFTVLFLLASEPRRASLRVCCNSSKRVHFHFILTIFGMLVYVYNGIILLVDEFTDFKLSSRLVIIGWCSRYVHVVADTIIIFGAFKALDEKDRADLQQALNSGSGSGSTNGVPSTATAPNVTSSFNILPRPTPVSMGKARAHSTNNIKKNVAPTSFHDDNHAADTNGNLTIGGHNVGVVVNDHHYPPVKRVSSSSKISKNSNSGINNRGSYNMAVTPLKKTPTTANGGAGAAAAVTNGVSKTTLGGGGRHMIVGNGSGGSGSGGNGSKSGRRPSTKNTSKQPRPSRPKSKFDPPEAE